MTQTRENSLEEFFNVMFIYLVERCLFDFQSLMKNTAC